MDPLYLGSLSALDPVSDSQESKNDQFPFQSHLGSAFKILLPCQVCATQAHEQWSQQEQFGQIVVTSMSYTKDCASCGHQA